MTSGPIVLLISGEYPPMEGGVADFTSILGVTLAEQGAQVHILTSCPATASYDALAGRGHRQVRVHATMPTWGWWALYKTMRHLLREIKPDVVNIQYQAAAYGMHPAINLLPYCFGQVPFVVTFHDLLVPYLFPKAGPVRWWVNLALARRCRAVIVTNAQDRERLSAYRALSNLQLIPIGSNIACAPPTDYRRGEWRRKWGIGKDTLLLCYFGFLNASKGGVELIAALAELDAWGVDAHLLMIGGAVGASDPTNRAYLDIVKRAIQERGLEQRVIWTGYMPPEEVSAAFCSADLCVLPYWDGASFRRGSFMAALTHGLPIISTHPRVTLPELVHGENVWLVPPADAHALAQAVARLAGDAPLRQRLGAGARALSRQFDWQHIAARTLEVYAGLL